MAVEIVAGQTYRNRRGEYEVLEVTEAGRLKVRYLADGELADLDKEQQLRILTNMQYEAQAQAQQVANLKPTPTPRSSSANSARSAKSAAPARETTRSAAAPARRSATPAAPTRSQLPSFPQLRPSVPVRDEFGKQEVLLLLQFIGYGNQDARFWFIGNQEIGPSDGNVILSERSEDPEFHKEFTDAKVYKDRYRAATSYPYGSPAWQYANYLTTHLALPPEEQSEENRLSYFQERFGASDGDVLLIDPNSLPASSFDPAHWPYRDSTINDSPRYNSTLRDPKLFIEDPLLGQDTRYKRLNELYEGLKLQKKAPRCIFCFGKLSSWRGFKEIFPLIHSYNDLELKLQPDREKTARFSLAQDDESGTRIAMLPPLHPQEGMTYFYLDQVASILLTLKAV